MCIILNIFPVADKPIDVKTVIFNLIVARSLREICSNARKRQRLSPRQHNRCCGLLKRTRSRPSNIFHRRWPYLPDRPLIDPRFEMWNEVFRSKFILR